MVKLAAKNLWDLSCCRTGTPCRVGLGLGLGSGLRVVGLGSRLWGWGRNWVKEEESGSEELVGSKLLPHRHALRSGLRVRVGVRVRVGLGLGLGFC